MPEAAGFFLKPLTPDMRKAAIRLVDRVFPSQDLAEMLSLRLFQTRWAWLLRLGGMRRGRFWGAIRGGTLLGLVGLYSMAKDEEEANWLGWFCVAPEARGLGLGQHLLDHAIGEARATGRRYLRLYTSTDPVEEAAQALYERNGFRIIARCRPWMWRLLGIRAEMIHRERDLAIEPA
ncbi:MAG: GNAT family N-acetyltransferase [Proteobacteria bacterium]|nr:GNAT family N-acetyltransferase [Pseudomonadota bacterium]